MSSTDLANEETKQSIKIAEQEALEHSILQKTTVPRAKITHKGFEDIEDINGENARLLEREREREREQEERMERERQDRIKAAQAARQRTMSMSIPPESPVAATNPTWSSQLPLPLRPSYSSGANTDPFAGDATQGYPQILPELSAEPELNLADLINIDDEPGLSSEGQPQPHIVESPVAQQPSEPAVASVVGVSPFAVAVPQTETQPASSFDLNSLWSGPAQTSEGNPGDVEMKPIEENVDEKDEPVEPLSTNDEQDFDMFLEEKDESLTASALQAIFDSRATVWGGKIHMPLDSTVPQETPVVARQMGGKSIATDSPLWKTLFPSNTLRIDGRVPVDKSAQFLLQIRMNSSKELIGVAFAPTEDDTGFKILMDFLIAKGRHGLVFPWGKTPSDSHPGRELYIIPLLSSDPLPDYMELMDDLCLPRVRTTNYLIGIWVLMKGKLVPPAPIPAPNQIPAPMLPPIPHMIPPAPNPIVPPVDPSILAEEVAQLTPEQIQLMLRSLTTGTSSIQQPTPLYVPPPPPPHPMHPLYPPGPPGPPGIPPYGTHLPPPLASGPLPPPSLNHGSPPHPHARPYREDRDHHHRGGGRDRDRNWRGGGGRNRNRNRGGGGGGGPGDSPPRQSDSGWSQRKNFNRGGKQGNENENQRQW